MMKSAARQRTRRRVHAILLSSRRYSINQIASIYEIDRDRVSQRIEWRREFEFDGLADEQPSGRPPKLSADEQAQALEIIREEPRSVRRAVSELARRLKTKVSRKTLKRLLRAARRKWKRLRR